MKRFVSYLYSIYNNQKIHNAGFARVELRTGRNRIDIHLRENGYAGKIGTVYLFTRQQENIQGISIGNINFRGNQADFRYEQPEENIGQTSWQSAQMNGILVIIDEQAAFLSQWDEQPVDTTRFEIWKAEKVQEEKLEEGTVRKNNDLNDKMNAGHSKSLEKDHTVETKNDQTEQHAESTADRQPAGIRNDQTEQHAESTADRRPAGMRNDQSEQNKGREREADLHNNQQQREADLHREQSAGEIGIKRDRSAETVQPAQTGQNRINNHVNRRQQMNPIKSNVQSDQSRNNMNNTDSYNKNTITDHHMEQQCAQNKNIHQRAAVMDSEKYSDLQSTELLPQRSENQQWDQTWRNMLRTYPVMKKFSDENNVLCIRIEIKDVRLLPEKYWSMVNNSFLLHGFFNYRHLAFGRIGQNWFVGIPGIYQSQEHVMASIFGFPDFLPQAEQNERGEQPGYWYRILEI